jgi:hypothetical protein
VIATNVIAEDDDDGDDDGSKKLSDGFVTVGSLMLLLPLLILRISIWMLSRAFLGC